ncbi:MAG: efflux RND transporter periplasmic adaptor subunit [Gammaproteobacteria bacterium]|nr:efflux RND transporter periplasmic adaptor subunit [Gammaproteobacteria bacterium]MBU1654370.1 efflux RND transporter periplasmic adaptor subunit [Gammaproteobacteria bacterium]MBU1961997.1 efflux RND transporter periplasmic adaptor subunit [Gammaproteobacteria bacterium]
MKTNIFWPAATLALTLLLAGCGEKPQGARDQAAEDHDGHGHAEAAEKITHFSDKTELFLEFPPLIAGQSSTFVAHFTGLADFKPLGKGRLTLVLSGGGAPDERFSIDAPAVPGIFKPEVIPQASGERELTLRLDTGQGTLTHGLGPVRVFPDAQGAAAAEEGQEHEEADGIPFSKEQQWKIDFAVTEAVLGRVRAAVALTGSIKARPDGEALLVAPAAGVLRAAGAFPRIGQAVKKGQVLALFNPRLGGENDQATLDAAAGKTRIALEQARRERERMEALFKEEAIPERRLIEARASERMAQGEAEAAGARARQLGGEGGGISLRAPIDGVIADVAASAGAFLAEGAPLLHIADTGHLWLEARVPESEIGRLGTPSGAAFVVEGFDRTFRIEPGKNGKLVAVGAVIDAATRTIPVIFEFANPDSALRLGLTARVQLFAGGEQEALLVPAGAVQDESGTQAVYVQRGGESFERRIVQTGARDGDRIAITAGLEAGQRVVSRGAYLIRLSTSKAGPAGHAH